MERKNSLKDAALVTGQSKDQLSVMEREKLRKAFKTFDTDGSNTLSRDELKMIFTRPGGGEPLSDDVAEALIEEFDKNGDGQLDMEEFIDCFMQVFQGSQEGKLDTKESYQKHKWYDRTFEANKKEITELFEMLDVDKSGYIEMCEMEKVVTLYQGEAFDADDFLGWYDSNHDSSEDGGAGKFDLKEFGCAVEMLCHRLDRICCRISHVRRADRSFSLL